jgi:two-component system LytT family response regulator/two-component system response regulator LytT
MAPAKGFDTVLPLFTVSLVASCVMESMVMVPVAELPVVATVTASDEETAFIVLKEEALRKFAQVKPEIVISDVVMPGMNGIDFVKELKKTAPDVQIIMISAHQDIQYVRESMKCDAIDYILKPFEPDRIIQTVERLKNYQQEEWNDAAGRLDTVIDITKIQIHKLPVEKAGKIILLNYNDIIYAYANTGNVVIVTAKDKLTYNGTLSELEERFAGTHMLRVHKSYIANLDRVQEVVPWFKGTYWLKMEQCPDTEIPISKSQVKDIKAILGLK